MSLNSPEPHIRSKSASQAMLNKYFTGNTLDYKQIIAIIIPIFVDQAFIILMSLLNTAMISSSGVAAVSAVSMVDSLNIFLINVFVAIATGGTVIVAQYKGSGNPQMAAKSASQAISAVTLLSVVLCLLVIALHTPILNLLFGGAEAEVFDNARLYLIGSCLSYPFIAIFQAVTGVLRGVAETRPCLILSLIMNLTFLGLNVLFITVLDMGILGLIISMLTARIIGTVTSLYYLVKMNQSLLFRIKNALKLDFSILKRIMTVGVPFAAEQMFFNGGKLLTQTFIVQLGTFAITANAIAGSISLVFQIGGSALSIAIVTVVGQCIGNRDTDDARKFIRSLLWLSSIFFVFIALILLPLFPFVVQLFSPPDEIVPVIFGLTLLIAIAQPFLWSVSFVLPSALRAAGDSNFTSITSLLSMWVLRIALGYILGITLGLGIMGVWIAMVVEWGVRGLIFWLRFRGEKWYSRKLI
ncbi:MATE family efflux transporter [Neobacillus mesonae]|nr:MATE family efflux transporter [Neobacillus mesonae]